MGMYTLFGKKLYSKMLENASLIFNTVSGKQKPQQQMNSNCGTKAVVIFSLF